MRQDCATVGRGDFLSLEEHHARDLQGYYAALVTHPHHNCYEGRADCDVSSWLACFLHSVALVFTADCDEIRATDVATELGVSDRTARELLNSWVADGWLLVSDPSRRGRRYMLSAPYRRFVGGLSADGDL